MLSFEVQDSLGELPQVRIAGQDFVGNDFRWLYIGRLAKDDKRRRQSSGPRTFRKRRHVGESPHSKNASVFAGISRIREQVLVGRGVRLRLRANVAPRRIAFADDPGVENPWLPARHRSAMILKRG
jgi:hypothetical protein